MRFREHLTENESRSFKDQADVKHFAARWSSNFYDLHYDNGKIRCDGHVNIDAEMLIDGYLPVQFSTTTEDFVIQSDVKIKSLIGCPELVGRNFTFQNKLVTSLVGSPKKVISVYKITDFNGLIKSFDGICPEARVMRLWCDGITSYHNVHKHIKIIYSLLETSSQITDSMLGVLLIRGNLSIIQPSNKPSDLYKAIEILNQHLDIERDVMECQEELIQAGLKEYARL